MSVKGLPSLMFEFYSIMTKILKLLLFSDHNVSKLLLRQGAAGSGLGGPVGGTLSSGLKKNNPMPQGSDWDIAMCRVLSI